MQTEAKDGHCEQETEFWKSDLPVSSANDWHTRHGKPVQIPHDWCDMLTSPSYSYQMCGGILYGLYLLQQVAGHTTQQQLTVVEAACNERLD